MSGVYGEVGGKRIELSVIFLELVGRRLMWKIKSPANWLKDASWLEVRIKECIGGSDSEKKNRVD